MANTLRYILILLVACSAWPAAAQKDQKPLPKVLIIGDQGVYQHARSVTSELKGKAAVTQAALHQDVPVLNSSTVLEHMDTLLGRIDRNGKAVPEEKWPVWDLIHVNVGLGDLVHRVPDMESFRLLPIPAGGVIATEPRQYEKNLIELVKQLKQKNPGAKIVWASTTPIRASRSQVYKMGSEIEYNKIAERVMKRYRVPINDMYTYATTVMNMDKPAGHGADPFSFDKKPIHPPIVEIIARELKIKLEKKPEPAKKG